MKIENINKLIQDPSTYEGGYLYELQQDLDPLCFGLQADLVYPRLRTLWWFLYVDASHLLQVESYLQSKYIPYRKSGYQTKKLESHYKITLDLTFLIQPYRYKKNDWDLIGSK